MADRLYRSRDDRMIAGVAGGVAENLDADPSIIRIVWAVLIFLTGGLALLVYIVMAIVVPEGPDVAPLSAEGTDPAGAATTDPAAATDPTTGAPLAAAGTANSWTPPPGRRRRRDRDDQARGALIGGLVLIVLGAFFFLRQFIPAFDLGFWWPVAAIGLGLVLVVIAVMPSRRSR